MKIGLYSATVGPAKMLKLIAEAAAARGHETLVGKPLQPIPAEQLPDFQSCDVLLWGPSALGGEYEVALVKAMPLATPIIVVDDLSGAPERPHLLDAGVVSRVHAAIVSMPQWIERTKRFGYREAVYLGPPAHWKTSYDEMTAGVGRRSEFRKRLGEREFPLEPDDLVFCLAGIKQHSLNSRLLDIIAAAGKEIAGEHFVFGFRPHPGEPTDVAAFAEREAILSPHWRLVSGGMSWPTIIKSADVPISVGGATDSLVAAYARLPLIYMYMAEVRQRLVEEGRLDGKWFVAELGGVMSVRSPEEAAGVIRRFLTEEGKQELRQNQEANFPLPESWDSAPRILDFVEAL